MTVTVFSESRVNLDDEVYRSVSPSTRGDAWMRGLSGLPSVRLAARVRDGRAAGEPVDGEVAALPNYTGPLELLRRLPGLMLAIDKAVRSSSVVVVRLPGPIGILASVAAQVRGIPTAVDLAGDAGEVVRAGGAGPIGRGLASVARRVTASAIRRASAVRYVTKETLQKTYPARPGVAVLGYSAVRLSGEWFALEPQVGRSERATLLSIGDQAQLYKGHDLVIRALGRIRDHYPSVHLTLVGAGRRQADLRDLAQRLGVSQNVTFAGYVQSREEVRRLIDEAWLYVHPSRTEGLPRALVEAMARGKACVATPVGGIPELLDADQIVPVDNVEALQSRVLALLGDHEARRALGERNLRIAMDFTEDRLRAQNEAWSVAVQQLIGHKGAGES